MRQKHEVKTDKGTVYFRLKEGLHNEDGTEGVVKIEVEMRVMEIDRMCKEGVRGTAVEFAKEFGRVAELCLKSLAECADSCGERRGGGH